jgi:hypothetical protein
VLTSAIAINSFVSLCVMMVFSLRAERVLDFCLSTNSMGASRNIALHLLDGGAALAAGHKCRSRAELWSWLRA